MHIMQAVWKGIRLKSTLVRKKVHEPKQISNLNHDFDIRQTNEKKKTQQKITIDRNYLSEQ